MLLHLLRHAHAGDWSAWDGPDAARPLTDKGRSQSERLGRFLAGLGFAPDAITPDAMRAPSLSTICPVRLGASTSGAVAMGQGS